MIRPVDIQEKEFGRGVRGYREDEVNQFLDEITVDLERLLNELRETKEENSRLVEELERYRRVPECAADELKVFDLDELTAFLYSAVLLFQK